MYIFFVSNTSYSFNLFFMVSSIVLFVKIACSWKWLICRVNDFNHAWTTQLIQNVFVSFSNCHSGCIITNSIQRLISRRFQFEVMRLCGLYVFLESNVFCFVFLNSESTHFKCGYSCLTYVNWTKTFIAYKACCY